MFDIQKGSRIVLYGYSRFDTVKYRYYEMKNLGYQMIGYIDQNANGIEEEMNIPCWTLDSFPYHYQERNTCIVIILLQNGRMHERIAKLLHDGGFDKVLYVPACINNLYSKKMIQKYNAFIRGEYEELTDIPSWDELLACSLGESSVFLRHGKRNCTVYVPIELLFAYALEDGGEENISFEKNYQELFAVLEGKSFSCNHYFEFMGADTDKKKDKLMSDRFNLYCFWENQRQYNMDYFIEAAAIAVWNPKGYFNIVDGHHRAAYLFSKGYKMIPISMTNEDYDKWYNCSGETEHEKLNAVPIPHPVFIKENCSFEPHWWSVIYYLYEIGHNCSCRLVEIDDYMGYYAAAFQRIVKRKAVVVTDSQQEISLCRSMQKYMHQNFPIIRSDDIEFEKHDIIYLKLLEEENDKMKYLQNACGKYIILDIPEKGSEVLFEKVIKRMGGNLRKISKYYDAKAHVICAVERSGSEWQN